MSSCPFCLRIYKQHCYCFCGSHCYHYVHSDSCNFDCCFDCWYCLRTANDAFLDFADSPRIRPKHMPTMFLGIAWFRTSGPNASANKCVCISGCWVQSKPPRPFIHPIPRPKPFGFYRIKTPVLQASRRDAQFVATSLLPSVQVILRLVNPACLDHRDP